VEDPEVRDTQQELLFNVTGQTLVFDIPEGRPSSVTSITVWRSEGDDDGQTESAAGSPSIDSVNTTVAAPGAGVSQSDPTAITVASATSIVKDRQYLLTATSGEYEWIEIASITGTSLKTRVPLMNDYAAASTLQSTRVTAIVDPTWIADKTKVTGELGVLYRNREMGDQDEEPWYRAACVYVVGGVTRKREIRFDVVRYTSTHAVTPLDVDNAFPGWLDRVPVDYRKDQGRRLIDEAFRALRNDLLAEGHTARWIRRGDVIGELLIFRANLKALETAVMHGKAGLDALNAGKDAYAQRYNQLIREPHLRIGSSVNGGIIGGRERSSGWRR
jgi:hypothetical protein